MEGGGEKKEVTGERRGEGRQRNVLISLQQQLEQGARCLERGEGLPLNDYEDRKQLQPSSMLRLERRGEGSARSVKLGEEAEDGGDMTSGGDRTRTRSRRFTSYPPPGRELPAKRMRRKGDRRGGDEADAASGATASKGT
eukprot:761413-Hanusia_phi.AAC.3